MLCHSGCRRVGAAMNSEPSELWCIVDRVTPMTTKGSITSCMRWVNFFNGNRSVTSGISSSAVMLQ